MKFDKQVLIRPLELASLRGFDEKEQILAVKRIKVRYNLWFVLCFALFLS